MSHQGQGSEFSSGDISATGQIGAFGVGRGIFVAKIMVRTAATSPTITLRDGGATGTLILNVWVVAAGDVIDLNHYFASGCHYTEVGAIILTFLYS